MTFLLDTNVLSEWVKPRPNSGVIAWLSEVDEDRVFISVITLAELRYGVERLALGRRRTRLDSWLREDLPGRFEGRILPIDGPVADMCGILMAKGEARGRPIATMDGFIAATTAIHRLTLVTRNTGDFATVVDAIVNPWTGDA
jgi:predicted nucleic acid-binding protein